VTTVSLRLLDAARASMLVTAASLPFSTAATNVFSALALLCWALSGEWRATLRAIAAEPAAWMGFALLAALLVGVSWSIAPPAEALSAIGKYRELALFGITMFLFSDARWRLRLLWVFFAAALALLVASYAILFGLFHHSDARGLYTTQGAVLLKNHITHGFIMSLLASGAIIVALRASGWRRWALGTVSVLAAANVWFAVQGRTGYIVMSVLLLWLAYARWSLRGLAASAIGLALVLAAAWQWAPAFQQRVNQAVTEARDYQVQHAPGEASVGIRLHFAKRSLDALAQRPVLGAGTGAWGEAFYEATANDPKFFHDRAHYHPHNEYLMLAVQLGPAGLLLFIALLATVFRRAGRLPPVEAQLARGLVLAFAVGCLFGDFFWDMTEGHLWAVLGGALFGAALNPLSAPQKG